MKNIYRDKRKKKNFTMIQNKVLQDNRIHFCVKGLLTFLLSLPDDWEFTVEGTAHNYTADGVDAIRSQLNVLKGKYNKETKYYIKEMTTDEHYILSDKKYEFEFSYQGENVPTVKIKADKFENLLKRGSVKGVKVDAEDKTKLSGAVIGLFKSDVKEFSEKNAIVTAKSAKDGSFAFKDIPYGVYQIKEITAPTGYKLTDKVFPVTINENGQVVEIKIEDEKIRGNVEVKKFDKDTNKSLTGAIFTLFKDTDGNGKYDATKDRREPYRYDGCYDLYGCKGA